MNRFRLLLVLLLFSCGLITTAQKPKMPTFNYLTIDLTSGNPTLYWTPPAFDPLYPNPTGYIIYKRIVDALSPLGRNEAIDTVGPGVTSYTDITSSGNIERLTYLIASNGPTEPSQLTSLHSNAFITSFYDSCNHKIDLEWLNYLGWGNRIKKYDVYLGNTSDWTTYSLYATLPGTTNRTSILNVNENQDYWVYVEATKDTAGGNGTIPYTTRSNLYWRFTDMPIHPSSMWVDSIIAEDRKINIYFKIDPSTELSDFRVVRWENSDSVKSIFSKKELYQFSDPSLTFYPDSADSWAARTRPFYYKIDALNSCPRVVKVTNHANSITFKIHTSGMKNHIEWDSLFIDHDRRLTNSARYRVTRYAYTSVALPPVYLPETDQLEIIDDVKSFEGQGYSIKFCYRVEGFERNTLGADVMYSRTRVQCTEIVPGVTMPDAIIPTDNYVNNGNARNLLIPIITFKANYTLSIYNRWGNLIFNGENKGWTGHLSNGQLAKEGVYVYRLVVHTAGDRDVTKIGNVTVIYQ